MILTLTTKAQNFEAWDNNFRWIFSGNLNLPEEARISVTSFIVDFEEKYMPENCIPVVCNLVRSDEFNPDGIVFSIPAKKRNVNYHGNILEEFPCDSSRPHSIVFTFEGLQVNRIAYAHINISIKSC